MAAQKSAPQGIAHVEDKIGNALRRIGCGPKPEYVMPYERGCAARNACACVRIAFVERRAEEPRQALRHLPVDLRVGVAGGQPDGMALGEGALRKRKAQEFEQRRIKLKIARDTVPRVVAR